MQPNCLFTSLLAFTPTSDHFPYLILPNMHSYKNVAVLALAASAVSPILAAPTPYGNLHLWAVGPGHHPDVFIFRESQNQARAELEARAIPMWAKLLGGGVAGLTLGPQLLSSLSGGLLKKAVEESTNAK
jgi:hypothetical protein